MRQSILEAVFCVETLAEALRRSRPEIFNFYKTERPHQALGYRTPAEVFRSSCSGRYQWRYGKITETKYINRDPENSGTRP